MWYKCIYKVCPEGIQLCHMKNRDIYWRRHKVQETLYVGQWCFSPPQSRHFWALTQFSQSPSATLLYFSESHWWSEISSLSRLILVFGKAKSHRTPNLGCRGPESPGWYNISPRKSAWDTMHERARCRDEAANHQLPIAAAFWNHLNSFHWGMFKLNIKSDADSWPFAKSLWIRWPHSPHAHSTASTAPID